MSEAFDVERPRRGRPPRAEAVAGTRRRRNAGSLNRMVQFKLDIFLPEQLDLDNWFYCWANDEGSNIRRMTKLDDYEFVTTDEIIGGVDDGITDSESNERIRILAGKQDNGEPLYVYFLKKPRSYWEEDNEAVVRAREDMMAGRVYHAAATESDEQRPGGEEMFYAPKSNQIGHAAQRRRGPVPRNLK